MGGKSEQKTTQQSTTAPWEAAQPALQGLLSQLEGNLGKTGLTSAENNAITGATNNAYDWTKQFAPQIGGYASDLLKGGGATDQAGNVNQGYQDYNKRLAATADGANIGQNSGLQPYLESLRSDITNQVNGQFAGAGRDFSGANFNALGRGITSGLAPVIAQQYNTDVANQRSAADALYGAGNTNAGILAGLQQQKLTNQGQGVTAAGQAGSAANTGYEATLAAEAQRRGIPVQALGLLAQIGVPIAALGSQNQGTSTTTKQASPLEQFMQFGQGIGSIFGGSNPAAGNIFKFFS
jgi:hypothetical protein